MGYKFYNDKRTRNRDVGNNNPKEIIIHHWGVDGQEFNDVVRYLCNNNYEASAHYVVESGKVAKIADLNDTTWHAGNYNVNSHSIGIECRPEMTDGDLKTLIELIANIYKKVGKVLHIRGHKDIVATACPGRYYKKLSYIEREATKLYKEKKKPKKSRKTKTNFDYITNADIHLREKKSLDSKSLDIVPEGTRLHGIIYTGAWIKTTYKGRTGYMKAQ